MMRSRFLTIATLFLIPFVAVFPLTVSAQDGTSEVLDSSEVTWGPADVPVENIATIHVPEDFGFVPGDGTKRLLEAMQNFPSGNEIGLIAPDDFSWFVVYEFERVGYVRDDEKTDLDSNAMLEQIKESAAESNKERRERGWPEMEPVGWAIAPNYNDQAKSLEWAPRYLVSGEREVVNFNTRVLGRYGVTNVTLVCDPESLTTVLPRFREIMTGYTYASGQTYAEFRDGDKIAKYGLSALVVGGGAAVAAKAGVFKWLWKVIVAALAGGAALFKKFFGKKKEQYSKLPGT